MTIKELKKLFDNHISTLPYGLSSDVGIIHVNPTIYQKAKYSCTEDDKDFKFIKGHVLYKGFEIRK